MRVLVVDDSADIANWLAEELQLLGTEVRVSQDGPSALKELEAFTPDAMLIDIALPSMNGWQLARQVRHLHGSPPRLIAISALGHETHRNQSRLAGFEAHLVKPIKIRDLETVLFSGAMAAIDRT
jgi:DNA-binding response OmpR family regulator